MPAGVAIEQEVAIRIHLQAVVLCLEEFHQVSAQEAAELVSSLKQGDSLLVLHTEPYLLAFELAKGDQSLPESDYVRHRPRALEIYRRAKEDVLQRAEQQELLKSLQDRLGELERELAGLREKKQLTLPEVKKYGSTVTKLPDDRKDRIVALYKKGKTDEEISKQLNLPVSRVRKFRRTVARFLRAGKSK